MLRSHFQAKEEHLLSISRIPANAGHPLHKGTPREAFIREFLVQHLSERVAVGTGEIIDAFSQPNMPRNQLDIVIYRRSFPKLDFGGGINAFLVESVVATIEVKSTLDFDAVDQSVKTARNVKQLRKSLFEPTIIAYEPPSVLNYVVAYDGPAQIETVYNWLKRSHANNGFSEPALGVSSDERGVVASPSIDAIFVLGKGFVQFDNTPMSFISDDFRRQHPERRWVTGNIKNDNLLILFNNLTLATNTVLDARLNPAPYLASIDVPDEDIDFKI